MVSRQAGHFVQVWRELRPVGFDHEYVDVERGPYYLPKTVSSYPVWAPDGWQSVSRECSLKDARKYARIYRNVGLDTRIILMDNSGKKTVVQKYLLKGSKAP